VRRNRVPLRNSLLVRLLATSILVALCSIAATAWLAVQTTTKAIEREQGQSLSSDASVYDTLVGYAAGHPNWKAVAPVIRAQAAKTGRRITLTTPDGKPLADSDAGGTPLPDQPSAVIDPLRTDPVLAAKSGTDRIDSRAVGPFRLSPADGRLLREYAGKRLDCLLSEYGLTGRIDTGPNGRPEVVVTSPDPKRLSAALCGARDAPILMRSEMPALGALNKLVNACLQRQGLTPIELQVDFSWFLLATAARPAPTSDQTIQSCIDAGRREQLRPYVAPAALLYVTSPGKTPTPDFDLSRTNKIRIISVTALVLVLAIAVTVLLGVRLVRPLRALTAAAQNRADQHVRVPVTRNDEIGYLAAAFNDLSERRENIEQQRKAMVSDVAHELRTPLTNMRSWLEAAEDGLATADPALMSLLLEEALLLQHIVDDLQDLAAADAGTLRLHPEQVHVNDLLEQVAGAHRGRAESAGVTLTTEAGGDPEINADPARLRQAVSNLVSNAVRHTPSGGSVTIRSAVVGAELVIDVVDTGSGISEADLPKVFDRFWRAEKSRSRHTGGSGLGLAIVRQLTQAHGGTVSVTSAPVAGATFTLRLPA
jgi:two-component system sensor histidine kinase BaeS